MGLTIAEKIIAKAAGRESVTPGEIVTCAVDLAMIHDSGGPRRVKPAMEKLGVGVMVSEEKIETGMLQALDQIDTFHAAYDRIGDIPDGAQQAAGILMNAIEK